MSFFTAKQIFERFWAAFFAEFLASIKGRKKSELRKEPHSSNLFTTLLKYTTLFYGRKDVNKPLFWGTFLGNIAFFDVMDKNKAEIFGKPYVCKG